MNCIVAVDMNMGIGYNNSLLYKIKNDMKRFRDKTINKTVVMGKNTFLSLPNGALKNRRNIVVSNTTIKDNNIEVVHSIDELSKLIDMKSDDVILIGGATLYNNLIDYCDKIYMTEILHNDKENDVVFPNIRDKFEVCEVSKIYDEDGILYRFITFKNKGGSKKWV